MLFLKSNWSARTLRSWLAGLVAAGVGMTAQAARTELDLNGPWQYQKMSQLTYPPPSTWQTVSVPGYLSGWQYEHAWFRRVFTLPSSYAGSRLKLRFGGVKYNAQVWLNGSFIGGYLNGYEPF
jgi:beta-galactosidase/beta-glucuronidase